MIEFRIDGSLTALGIDSIVIGIAKNVDPTAPLSESFLKKQKEMEGAHCGIEEYVILPTTCPLIWPPPQGLQPKVLSVTIVA